MKSRSMLEYIQMVERIHNNETITLEEFTRIRNEGTPDEIAEAVERMMMAGGYENLE